MVSSCIDVWLPVVALLMCCGKPPSSDVVVHVEFQVGLILHIHNLAYVGSLLKMNVASNISVLVTMILYGNVKKLCFHYQKLIFI
jgi:hypothetical protein